jgi:hypothetical protein
VWGFVKLFTNVYLSRPLSSASGRGGLHKPYRVEAILCEVYAGLGQDHGYKPQFHARKKTFAI